MLLEPFRTLGLASSPWLHHCGSSAPAYQPASLDIPEPTLHQQPLDSLSDPHRTLSSVIKSSALFLSGCQFLVTLPSPGRHSSSAISLGLTNWLVTFSIPHLQATPTGATPYTISGSSGCQSSHSGYASIFPRHRQATRDHVVDRRQSLFSSQFNVMFS